MLLRRGGGEEREQWTPRDSGSAPYMSHLGKIRTCGLFACAHQTQASPAPAVKGKAPECPHLCRCSQASPLLKPCTPTPHLEHKLQGNSICRKTCPAAARGNTASPLPDSYSSTPKTSRVFSSSGFYCKQDHVSGEGKAPTLHSQCSPTAELQEGAKADLQLYTEMSLP